jgi:tetratricopeptide (TPR) repeat protein
MIKASTKILFAVLIGALIVAAGFYYYFYYYQPRVNYLIPSVPYNGVYNLFFERADSTALSSVMDILGYWGDERFSLPELKKIFMEFATTSSAAPGVLPPYETQSTFTMKKFFEDNGYETYRWASSEAGDELKEIKKFVNSQKRIPVIIYQNRHYLDSSEPVSGFRVVIGVFDKDKKVIVHDHDFGNNYEISYDNFEKMFQPNSRAILAVWPSNNLKASLKGPDYSASYPPRLESMDKIGLLLTTKGAQAVGYLQFGNFEKSSALLKEMIDSPDFQYFPPAFQVMELYTLALSYYNLGEYDKAIKLITERVMPMNQNLNKPFPGWVTLPGDIDRMALPYILLSRAYLKSGQRDLALAAYKEMVKWRDLFYKETGDKYYLNMKINELEKEISKKK